MNVSTSFCMHDMQVCESMHLVAKQMCICMHDVAHCMHHVAWHVYVYV